MKRAAFCFFLFAYAATVFGGARHFGYLYEAPTAPPGSCEIENYATGTFSGDNIDANFRHELEIGLTEHLQAGIYFANWDYLRCDSSAHYRGASVELIYNLTNPAADFLGISLYQEIGAGRRAFESETKFIAQKDLGRLILAYNLTLEVEWENAGLRDRTGEVQNAIGASYEVNPSLSGGIELLHEFVFPDWRSNRQNFFAGPNVSYRGDRWFATLTALRQFTSSEDEPDYEVRLIFGLSL